MKDEERVFRLTRRDGVTYWSGPYDPDDWRAHEKRHDEEVRFLSIADAFDAAYLKKRAVERHGA
mgnify:CR=1 FL=1